MTTTMTISTPTPTSPVSPTRKRRSLRIPSIQSNYESPPFIHRPDGDLAMSFHSRKSSYSSCQQYSPTVPRPASSRSKRPSSSRLSIGSNISTGLASNPGFGNLADELEEAWDPELDEPDSAFLDGLQEGDPDQMLHSPSSPNDFGRMMMHQSPRASRGLLELPEKPPSPSKQWASMGTHLKTESLYDGSDYGPSSDDEAFDHIAPSLQRKMHDLEEITQIASNADALSELGGVIPRTTTALRDSLGAQGIIESSASRLSTAYTSLAAHRTHQSREIVIASYPLLSSGAFSAILDLPPEIVEMIITELDSLAATLPFLPSSSVASLSTNPLHALQSFARNTHDLLTTLHGLTDTLIEHRQHLFTATRRLKSVRELVDELRTEEDLVETSILLIQAGDWDRRCRERHAATAVGELLEGFKDNWDIDYIDGAWQPDSKKSRFSNTSPKAVLSTR